MITAKVEYRRYIGSSLSELVKIDEIEANSKTDLMKKVRVEKKMIASKCKYKTTGDVVVYFIRDIKEDV